MPNKNLKICRKIEKINHEIANLILIEGIESKELYDVHDLLGKLYWKLAKEGVEPDKQKS